MSPILCKCNLLLSLLLSENHTQQCGQLGWKIPKLETSIILDSLLSLFIPPQPLPPKIERERERERRHLVFLILLHKNTRIIPRSSCTLSRSCNCVPASSRQLLKCAFHTTVRVIWLWVVSLMLSILEFEAQSYHLLAGQAIYP